MDLLWLSQLLLLSSDQVVAKALICRIHSILVSESALSISPLHYLVGGRLLFKLGVAGASLPFDLGLLNYVWLSLLGEPEQVLLLD